MHISDENWYRYLSSKASSTPSLKKKQAPSLGKPSPKSCIKLKKYLEILLTLGIKPKALSLYHMQTVSPICIIMNSPSKSKHRCQLKKKKTTKQY